MNDKIRAAIMAVVLSGLPLLSLFGLELARDKQDLIQLFVSNVLLLAMMLFKSGQEPDAAAVKHYETMIKNLEAENLILRSGAAAATDPPSWAETGPPLHLDAT